MSRKKREKIDSMTLWDVPTFEWAKYVDLVGDGCVTWEEYQLRLRCMEQVAQEKGMTVDWLRCPVETVVAAMDELGVPNTPEGRAAGIAVAIAWEKIGRIE